MFDKFFNAFVAAYVVVLLAFAILIGTVAYRVGAETKVEPAPKCCPAPCHPCHPHQCPDCPCPVH